MKMFLAVAFAALMTGCGEKTPDHLAICTEANTGKTFTVPGYFDHQDRIECTDKRGRMECNLTLIGENRMPVGFRVYVEQGIGANKIEKREKYNNAGDIKLSDNRGRPINLLSKVYVTGTVNALADPKGCFFSVSKFEAFE